MKGLIREAVEGINYFPESKPEEGITGIFGGVKSKQEMMSGKRAMSPLNMPEGFFPV
jgi:hypothetical protein